MEEFAVVCVFVFEFRVEAVKFCYDAASVAVFFPCFPARLRFPVEVAHRPECPPDDGADAAPYGAPEYTTPLPPEQMQRKEYADYPAGHAIILHDKLPNIKDDFFGDGHGLGTKAPCFDWFSACLGSWAGVFVFFLGCRYV